MTRSQNDMSFSPLPLLRNDRPADAIYVELVDSLFSVVPPIAVFLVSLAAVGLAIVVKTGDPVVLALTLAGLLVSAERILLIRRYRRVRAASTLSAKTARAWEKNFAVRSIVSAAIVSVIGARCFMLPYPSVHMLIAGFLIAYSAGTVTRIPYRPRLAVTNLLVVAIPINIACLAHGGEAYWCLSLVMIIFLFGAFETVEHLYKTIVSQLTLKQRFAGLARRDPLTGLANRLALGEDLDAAISATRQTGRGLAVHSLDLDRFKAANDRFGHPVGDALLQIVARRLQHLSRESDLVVRLGGDEFVLVQIGIDSREQALALANRVIEAISAPCEVKGHMIDIGTSIGIALLPIEDLTGDDLLARADQALYQAKRSGSGYAVYTPAPQLVSSMPDVPTTDVPTTDLADPPIERTAGALR
jgi:diguanylate cyclase (GGDEF)-like protein